MELNVRLLSVQFQFYFDVQTNWRLTRRTVHPATHFEHLTIQDSCTVRLHRLYALLLRPFQDEE